MVKSYKASHEAFANAKDFIKDAETAHRRGRHGHAFAFLVLAEEEIGKGFLLQWQTLGLEIPKQVLNSHHPKQAMMLFMVMMDMMITDFILGMHRIIKEGGDVETARRRIEQFVARRAYGKSFSRAG